LGRLNADGSGDANFNASANGAVFSLAVQTDGNIIAGGSFTNLSGQAANYVGRLNTDGTLDSTFNSFAGGTVNSLTIQPDGQILTGGSFLSLCGQYRSYLGRLNNSGSPTESLSFNGSNLAWLRGGTSPECLETTFDLSTDGVNWSALGNGIRMPGGWISPNLSAITTNAIFRIRGFVASGYQTGSSWFVQNIYSIDPKTRPAILASEGGFGITANQFGFDVAGLVGQVIVLEGSTNLMNWVPLQTNQIGTVPLPLNDPSPEEFPQRFYRVRLQ
jgi:hypothetical protein